MTGYLARKLWHPTRLSGNSGKRVSKVISSKRKYDTVKASSLVSEECGNVAMTLEGRTTRKGETAEGGEGRRRSREGWDVRLRSEANNGRAGRYSSSC